MLGAVGKTTAQAPRSREDYCTVDIDGRKFCIDPLAPVFEVLGRKWSLFIVVLLGNNRVLRFGELQTALPGISPRTLSDRLKELEEVGILSRAVFPEVPLRVEYTLTPNGEALRQSLVPMLGWAVLR